jgi:hypothetical protein
MVERRDYQAFLRASAIEKTSMRKMMALLPAPPPRATLWTQAGLLVASSLLPLALWLPGRLDALGVILLYLVEGLSYGLAVGARVLFTAAPGGTRERPRTLTAIFYLVRHALLWSALGFGTLALLAPDTGGAAFESWLFTLALQLRLPSMWIAAAATAFFLAQDVMQRSDYIDAYLELGPREVARYGYTYPFALVSLVLGATVLWFLLLGHQPEAQPRGTPLMSPTFFAVWLIAWRMGMGLSNLTLPLWGRALALFEGRFEQAMGAKDQPPG